MRSEDLDSEINRRRILRASIHRHGGEAEISQTRSTSSPVASNPERSQKANPEIYAEPRGKVSTTFEYEFKIGRDGISSKLLWGRHINNGGIYRKSESWTTYL
ncbi:C'' protein [Harrison Dam virus]|uniref:C'' protein n=1 Tax=Harrison Dam virus TaxID=1569259 RepID=A0A0A0V7W9_9RHAB|nr:C'' protein [Harrison Dam virus]AIW61121.1 C'' protein [Harrison Dam virus]